MDVAGMLRAFCAAVERRDGAAFAALFSEDAVYHDVFYGDFVGRAKIAEMIDDWFYRTARDFRWDMHEPVCDGVTLYVERPVAQIASRVHYQGSYSTIYGLTRRGAGVLRHNGEEVRRRLLDAIDKERGAGWRFVEHAVSIAEFWVLLELAVRKRDDVRILERAEILEDARADRLVRLEATVRLDGALRRSSVVPDAMFGLRINDEREQFFMVEIDRGEMPVQRYRNVQQTHFAKKMLTYYEASRQRSHVRDLGIPNFRVLTVTTALHRADRMVAAQQLFTQGKGSNLFLFADAASLASRGPLRTEWVSGKGERVRIDR